MSKAREAAERLKAVLARQSLGSALISDQVTETDVGTVVDAILAESQADDDEPISPEWLGSIGFAASGDRLGTMKFVRGEFTAIRFWFTGETPFCVINCLADQTKLATRRQVRALLKLLALA